MKSETTSLNIEPLYPEQNRITDTPPTIFKWFTKQN